MSSLANPVTASHSAALARLGNALSDQTRIGILLSLRESSATPSELTELLGVSKQVISNQLACLKGCGLVESVRVGRRSIYNLTNTHIADILDDLMRAVLILNPDCCTGTKCACI